MKFTTKNSAHSTLNLVYNEKHMEWTENTKFLGLQIDNHNNHKKWKSHIEEMIPTWSGACYAARSVVHVSNISTLKSIYYTYFHSIIKYGIIFWGNSSTVGRFSLYKRKSSELWLVHNPEPHVQVYLNNSRFYLFHASIHFH